MLEGTVADQNTKLATLRHKVISQEGLLQAKEFSKVLNEDLAFTFYSESEKIREINTTLIKEVSDRNEDLLCARDYKEKLKKQLGQLRLQLQLSAARTLFFKYLYFTPAQQSIKIDTLYTSNAWAELCNRPITLDVTPGLISKQLNTSFMYLVKQSKARLVISNNCPCAGAGFKHMLMLALFTQGIDCIRMKEKEFPWPFGCLKEGVG